MKTYFYVIEWYDGSGKTAGLVEASLASDAFFEVTRIATKPASSRLYGPGKEQLAGDIIAFNKVD